MHMPLLLLAGIFDMVHFELKLGKLKVPFSSQGTPGMAGMARTSAASAPVCVSQVGAHRLMIFMQNVILVLGPGRSEASVDLNSRNVARTRKERSADWNYADVKEAKTKTIRLAAKLLEGFAAWMNWVTLSTLDVQQFLWRSLRQSRGSPTARRRRERQPPCAGRNRRGGGLQSDSLGAKHAMQ